MRRLFFVVVALVLAMMSSCRWFKSKDATENGDSTAVKTEVEKDSTLYGKVVDDFGMSSFAVQLASGEELELLRSHQDGGEAEIFGDVQVGDEFAITTIDGGEALNRAINVTEVRKFTQDFKIVNAKLVLNVASSPDTVQILTLDADSLVAKGAQQTYRLSKTQQ